MSGSHGLCRFCLIFLLTIVFLVLLFYLTYRPIKPRYYLTAFSLLLNSSSSSSSSAPSAGAAVASFELGIKNRNKELGVYHDDLGLSLCLPPFNSSSSATAVVPGFYQGHQRTASKAGFFILSSSSSKRPWAAVANGSAVLRIAVESAVRYKAVAWRSRRHRVSLAAEVAIDGEGKKTAEDRIRFHSCAPRVYCDVPFRHSIIAVVLVAFAALMLSGRL